MGSVTFIQNYNRKNLKEIEHLEDLYVGGRIILKVILDKEDMKVWNRLNWFWIGSYDKLLGTRSWTFGFLKSRELLDQLRNY
jgi:hypothetical protein